MRPIDANTFKVKIKELLEDNNEPYSLYCDGFQDAVEWVDDLLDAQPTIEPIKRGEWINTYGDTPLDPRDKNYWWHCSECGHSVSTSFKSNFCPCCGARMEGD